MKWRWIIGSFTITIVFAGTVPVIPQEMKWIVSYETVAFETVDGDLGLDEYAIAGDGEWYIREVSKDDGQFVSTTIEPKDKTEVAIRCEKCAYYSHFLSSSGDIVRVSYDQKSYNDGRYTKDAPQPTKTELTSIISPLTADATIALDGVSNASGSDITSITSLSWSHTVTSNANGIIVIGTEADNNNDPDRVVTSVTYNGDSLTKIREDNSATATDLSTGIWYRLLPDTGANTATVNYTGNVSFGMAGAISLTGVSQSNPVDVSNTAVGASGNPSVDVLTITNGAWVFDSAAEAQGSSVAYTEGAGQTDVWIVDSSSQAANGSYEGPQSPAGTVTMSWTCTGAACSSVSWITSAAAFAPVSESGFEWGQII